MKHLILIGSLALGAVLGCGDDDGDDTPAVDAGDDDEVDASVGDDDAAIGDDDAGTDADGGGDLADGGSGGFVSFRYAIGYGPCPPEMDCSSFTELLADGTLRYDRDDETPVVVHEMVIEPDDFTAAVEAFTDPALIAILDLGEMPCEPPSDVGESMTLVDDGGEHTNSVTFCKDPPLVAARDMVEELTSKYFPE
jgi:hypothetical protein